MNETDRPALNLEELNVKYEGGESAKHAYRSQVPGGWLIFTYKGGLGGVTFYPDPKDILERHFCLPGGGSGSPPIYPGENPVTFTANGPYLQDTRSQLWPHYRDNYLASPPNSPTDIGYTGSGQAPANGIAWILHNWMKWGDGDITRAVVE